MEIDFSEEMAIQKYLPLMHELAIRIDLVAQAFDGKLGLPAPYAREYAYLQFRRMCELIALGCLQLHGDLPDANKKSVKKEWNAERIMNLLLRSHHHSFPQSLTRTKENNEWHFQANSKPNALTLKEFKQLYAECGHVLHRGTIRTVELNRDITKDDYDRSVHWQNKIVDLMNDHIVTRANGEGMYHVSLRTESGYPEGSIFTLVKPGGFHVHTVKMKVPDGVVHSYVANSKP